MSKLIKKYKKEYSEGKKNKIIREILENTASTKKITNKLAIGRNWITYLTNNNGEKIYDRIGINKIATKFYEQLYDDDKKEVEKDQDESGNKNEEEIQDIMKAEVEAVVKNLKKGKCPGPDNITNERKYKIRR